MTVTLFQLIKEEKGILVSDYHLWNYREFKEKVEKPVIKMIYYEKAIMTEDFVKNKALEWFEDTFKREIDFMETNLHTEMHWMRGNFKENVGNSSINFILPDEALRLINEVRSLPQHKYLLLNIDKINNDLMSIYFKY